MGVQTPCPEIQINTHIASYDYIKKHMGQSHGMSAIAISLIDPINADLEMRVVFDTINEMNNFIEYVLGVWKKFIPVPSFIRSYLKDDVYVKSLNGVELEEKALFPSTVEEFKGKTIIIDIVSNKTSEYLFKFYKFNDTKPRLLYVSAKETLIPSEIDMDL